MEERFMLRAIELAEKAASFGESPVGCVVVCDGEIVGEGYNLRERSKNALAHAELMAIDDACHRLGGWRLWKCDLYVTLEPCPMCAGAIINSRIKNVYFGASDPKNGSFGSIADLSAINYTHKPQICGGIMGKRCSSLLTDFFRDLRKKEK